MKSVLFSHVRKTRERADSALWGEGGGTNRRAQSRENRTWAIRETRERIQ